MIKMYEILRGKTFKELAIGDHFHTGKANGIGMNSDKLMWREFEKISLSKGKCINQIGFGNTRDVGGTYTFSANSPVYPMDITESLREDVAGEIYNQIRLYDPRAFMAWGSQHFVKSGPNQGIIEFMHPNDGYLMFDVNCPKFKGRIIILLMLDDTYSIVFGKVGKDSTGFIAWRVDKIVEDVYVEDLVRVIDDFVG